ncbi:hypothetical protein [Chryseobacterium sp. G0201]|uniref:hypothetical protein n=1 Tax=Chryseobacterium sp. G0201 TaxID=2487065 RepID=UPI0013DE61BF|nr:hypothetical protein [Chryseobacterium sp. G0201]
MKKQNKDKKKLSLKKLQIIKISDMKTIKGGSINQVLNFNGGDDPTDPTVHQTMGQQ